MSGRICVELKRKRKEKQEVKNEQSLRSELNQLILQGTHQNIYYIFPKKKKSTCYIIMKFRYDFFVFNKSNFHICHLSLRVTSLLHRCWLPQDAHQNIYYIYAGKNIYYIKKLNIYLCSQLTDGELNLNFSITCQKIK